MEDILDNFENGPSEKKRHGCVSAWLIFLIIINALSASSCLFFGEFMVDVMPNPIFKPFLYILGMISILNVVFSVMLLQWKKFGFFGFIGTSLVSSVMNIYAGLSPTQFLFGLVGIALLYAVLQIKEDKTSAWDHLE